MVAMDHKVYKKCVVVCLILFINLECSKTLDAHRIEIIDCKYCMKIIIKCIF